MKILSPPIQKFFHSKRELVIVLILLVLSLLKLYQLDGGLVLGEPDEHTHALIVENLKQSPYPQVDGRGWYFGLPLYFYLSYFVSFVAPLRFLALRLVSLVASLILSIGIFSFVRKKVNLETGFFSALFFILSPLSIFYSRLGLIEMTVVTFIFLFLFTFDLAVETRRKLLAIISGIFLGLAILTKYTALPFIIIPLLFIAYSFIRPLLSRNVTMLKSKLTNLDSVNLDIVPTLSLLSSILVFPPLALLIYKHDPFIFKEQVKSVFGGQTGLHFYPSYFSPLPYWLGLIPLVLGIVGILFVIKNGESKLRLFVGYFFFAAYFVFTRDELVPRYFLILVPFTAIFAGIGLNELLKYIYVYSKKFPKLPSQRLPFIRYGLALLVFVVLMPAALNAFSATHHTLLEDAGKFIHGKNLQDKWVFSNYWPPQIGYAADSKKYTWVADCAWETQAFSHPPENLSSIDILKSQGGFVVLEDDYVSKLINPDCRTRSWTYIKDNFQPLATFSDQSSNFPFFKTNQNKIDIYEIRAE